MAATGAVLMATELMEASAGVQTVQEEETRAVVKEVVVEEIRDEVVAGRAGTPVRGGAAREPASATATLGAALLPLPPAVAGTVTAREGHLAQREAELETQQKVLWQQQQALSAHQEAIHASETTLAAREAALAEQTAELERQRSDVERREATISRRIDTIVKQEEEARKQVWRRVTVV